MSKITRTFWEAVVGLSVGILFVSGCSPESNTGQNYDYYPTDPDSTQNGDSSVALLEAVNNVPHSAEFPTPIYDGGEIGDERSIEEDLTEDAACAAFSAEAKQIEVLVPTEVEVEIIEVKPVAIYLILDQSLSMNEFSVSGTKWQVAVSAINAFVNDPDSTSIDLALQYFPLIAGDCLTGAAYDTPEVAMGRLPDNATNISNSLSRHEPGEAGWLTPIEGALRGVTSFCSRFKQDTASNPDDEDCIAVLVTDGVPTLCSNDSTILTNIVANAFTQHSVRTFTIGMGGADFNLLDRLAQAGNGDCTPDPADSSWACNASSGGTTFTEALNAIRETITTLETRTEMQTVMQTQQIDCEWAIPDPPNGEDFDKDFVNVRFSPTGDDRDNITFRRTNSEATCGASPAWYYDNMDNPATIIACPNTCDAIKAAHKGKIEILFGCKTEIF
jgi:hypothetical protein